MNFNDWVTWQLGRAQWTPSSESISVFGLGLAGETGEVLEHFKKYLRDGTPIERNEELALEFGDVLFYWLKLLQRTGYTVEEVLDLNHRKLLVRDATRAAVKR